MKKTIYYFKEYSMKQKKLLIKKLYILFGIILLFSLIFNSCVKMFVPARFRTDFFEQTQIDSIKINDDYQLLKYEGEPYDLGLKMGYAFQELGLELEKMQEEKKRHYLALLEIIKEFRPGWIDYSRGIAAAFNLNYDEVYDQYYFFPIAMNIDFSCSALFVNSNLTIDDNNYMARNYDFTEIKGNIWQTNITGGYKVLGHDMHFSYPALMDGMNEYGLSIITNLVTDSTEAKKEWSYPLPEYTGMEAIYFPRMILETCQNTEEARALIEQVAVYSSGPPIHYIVADRQGNSFIAEFSQENGKATIIPKSSEAYYQILTNFDMVNQGYQGNFGYKEGPCIRFDTLNNYFKSLDIALASFDNIHEILYSVRMSEQTREMNQGFSGVDTQIQLIYNLNQGLAVLYFPSDDFKEEYTINLLD